MHRDTAVGEIQSVTSAEARVVFLGVPCAAQLLLQRSALEGAGVLVRLDEYFVAEVDLDATTPEELQPTNFAPLPRDSELETV